MANNPTGRGPRLPRNLKPDLERINGLLTDISTKITALTDLDDTFRLNVEIKGEGKFAKLEHSMKNASKANATLAKNLDALARSEQTLNKSLEENMRKLDKAKRSLAELNALEAKQLKLQQQHQTLSQVEYDRLQFLTLRQNEYATAIIASTKAIAAQHGAFDKLDSKAMVVAKTLGNQVLGAVDKFGKALISLSIDSVFLGFELIQKGILKFYDLMERTTKATGAFNLGLGGMTEGLDKTRKSAWKVEGQMRSLTGGELGVGLRMWEETAHGVGFVGEGFDEMTTKATLASRALGIGGHAGGELTHTWIQLGSTSKDVNRQMVQVSDAANLAGVSVADFGKEIVGTKGFMATFGKASEKVFLRSAAFAKKLGVSLQSLQRFTEMTDTFESTAEAAAKMNVVFGTSINSMELMLEQDPSKRLEMVRNQLKMQGKSWETMNRQERKFFAQTMQLSEEEAAGVLNNNITLEEFQKRQEQAQKKKVSDEDKIRAGLLKTTETLHNFGQSWDRVTAAVGRLLHPFLKVLGLASDLDGKMSFGQKMTKLFDKLIGFVDKLTSNKKISKVIGDMAADFGHVFELLTGDGKDSREMIDTIADSVAAAAKSVKELYNFGKEFVKRVFTKQNMTGMLRTFETIVEYLPGILKTFVALKAVMGGVSIISGIGGIVNMLTGTSGFMAALRSLTPAITSVTSSFVGKAGLAAAAGMVGWEIGRFVGSLEVGGKKIDDWVVLGYEKISEFFSSLWKAFRDSKLGELLGIKDTESAALDKAGINDQNIASYRSAISQANSGASLSARDLARLDELRKDTRLLEAIVAKSNGMFNTQQAFRAVQITAGQRATFAKQEPRTVSDSMSPDPARQSNSRTPVNRAPGAQQKSSGGGVTFVAGDVILDGSKVGQVLMREAAVNGG